MKSVTYGRNYVIPIPKKSFPMSGTKCQALHRLLRTHSLKLLLPIFAYFWVCCFRKLSYWAISSSIPWYSGFHSVGPHSFKPRSLEPYPLSRIPLGRIPSGRIPLGRIPISRCPLSRVPFSRTSLIFALDIFARVPRP